MISPGGVWTFQIPLGTLLTALELESQLILKPNLQVLSSFFFKPNKIQKSKLFYVDHKKESRSEKNHKKVSHLKKLINKVLTSYKNLN